MDNPPSKRPSISKASLTAPLAATQFQQARPARPVAKRHTSSESTTDKAVAGLDAPKQPTNSVKPFMPMPDFRQGSPSLGSRRAASRPVQLAKKTRFKREQGQVGASTGQEYVGTITAHREPVKTRGLLHVLLPVVPETWVVTPPEGKVLYIPSAGFANPSALKIDQRVYRRCDAMYVACEVLI